MSSNLPDGVNENTVGAPWNEPELKRMDITVILFTSIDVPLDQDEQEIRNEVRDQINRGLRFSDTYFDIE